MIFVIQVSQNAGCDASLEVIRNTDHFSVIHDFINDGYKGTEVRISCYIFMKPHRHRFTCKV